MSKFLNKVKYINGYFLSRFRIAANITKIRQTDVLYYDYKGLAVAVCEDVVRFNNSLFAMVDHEQKTILVDKDFLKLSDNCKKFILEHEVGHIEAGIEKALNGRLLENEIEADMYAVNSIGLYESIAALKELYSVINNLFGSNNREILDRINHLYSL